MPSITRDQFNRWNAKAKNGFTFDIQHYCIWGEKTLTKYIPVGEDEKIELHLHYTDERRAYGITTGRQIPILTVTLWKIDKTLGTKSVFMTSGSNNYKRFQIGEIQDGRKYDYLCKLSETINADDYIKEVA